MSRVVTVVSTAARPPADRQPLFVEFVNTLHWYDGAPIELFGDAPALATWLTEQRLPSTGAADALPLLRELRPHLRAITERLAAQQPPEPADLAALNAALSAPMGRLVLLDADSREARLAFETETEAEVRQDTGWIAAFRIALSLATFLESGD